MFTLFVPIIVQRVLGGTVNACSRLPHHGDVFNILPKVSLSEPFASHRSVSNQPSTTRSSCRRSSWCLNLFANSSEADRFSKSSQSAVSKSPDHLPPARTTDAMTPGRHLLTYLMQPRLVFCEDGFVANSCSEPDRRSVKCYTQAFLFWCLAIGHFVVRVS